MNDAAAAAAAPALLYVSLAKFESGMISSLHSMPLPACNSGSLTPQDFGTSIILLDLSISIGTSNYAVSALALLIEVSGGRPNVAEPTKTPSIDSCQLKALGCFP